MTERVSVGPRDKGPADTRAYEEATGMHEMVLVHKALDVVLDACGRNGVTEVGAVHLTIGEATDVVEDYVGSMFRFLARGTAAENARLVIRRVPLAVRCNACGEVFPIDVRRQESWSCPGCGVFHDYRLVSGREFRVDSIECAPGSSVAAAS